MIKAGVVGATGYAGAELVRLLAGHPDALPTILTSRQFAGIRFDTVYPAMAGEVGLTCESLSVERLIENCDVVFTALPHKIPMTIVPELVAGGTKVVDLSADFRFSEAEQYEAHYQQHTARDLLEKAVYGLCEVYREAVQGTVLVGNPGCYPTSALLPLVPLLKSGMLEVGSIVVDSKSGVSGAGRSLSISSHFCEADESFKAYKVATHRHNPEIDAILSREAGRPVSVTFVPHLVPMARGMFTTIYAVSQGKLSMEEVRNCLSSYYEGRRFVRIVGPARVPDTRHVRGTNYCDIGFTLDEPRGRLILMSAIDNLVKGAAGQAVQNMNIMFGLDETAGLTNVPFPV
ncbi:MAG: N-acetyl-gamma-glutamyl-phosphate reductase [Deltaproteobacteria bacterium]|nr:N-acetyl-gamma-glutamyl-phosphate reductase [Deltaproteobacteria bacterium]